MFKSRNNYKISRFKNLETIIKISRFKNFENLKLFREFKISKIAKNEKLEIFEFQNFLYEIAKSREFHEILEILKTKFNAN